MKMLWLGVSDVPSSRALLQMEQAKAAGHDVEYQRADYITRQSSDTLTMIYFDEAAEIPPEQHQASAEKDKP